MSSLRLELLDRHAGEGRGEDLLEVVHREFGDRLPVAGEHGLERLDVRQLRLRLDQRRHAVEAVDHLRIHRMLDPQRAVLIEGGDALLRRHEILARLVGCYSDEFEDRLFRRSVVPRCERRRGLCLRRSGVEKSGEGGQCRNAAKHKAAT